MTKEELAAKDPLLQFFTYDHLPENLQKISMLFYQFAVNLVDTLPQNQERTRALSLLMQAKDSAVRSSIMVKPATPRVV